MIRTEAPRLLLHENLRHATEQRVERIDQFCRPLEPLDLVQLCFRKQRFERGGNVPGETLQDWRHAQFTLSGENAFPERLMLSDPGLRERTAITIQATHPL